MNGQGGRKLIASDVNTEKGQRKTGQKPINPNKNQYIRTKTNISEQKPILAVPTHVLSSVRSFLVV